MPTLSQDTESYRVKTLQGFNCFSFKGMNMTSKEFSILRFFSDSLSFDSHIKKNFKSLTLLFFLRQKVCLSHIQICLVRPHNIMRLKTPNCRICSFSFVYKCYPSVLLLFFALCSIKGWGLLKRKIIVPEIVRKSSLKARSR